jgi:FKBP-type peptidyl-prolyl cis-trans isomerase SlyD
MSTAAPSIDTDKVVTFHYSLRDSEESFIESSEGKEPVVYMHGHNNIVPGLEEQMAGKQSGAKFTASVAPEKAYGLRDPNAVQRVPIKHLATRGRLVPGQMVAVNTREGARHALVLKVGHFNVDLDLNHPLAGRTLVFDIEIVDVRDATAEELAHGHAHGPHGHDHDHGGDDHDHDHDHDEHDHDHGHDAGDHDHDHTDR